MDPPAPNNRHPEVDGIMFPIILNSLTDTTSAQSDRFKVGRVLIRLIETKPEKEKKPSWGIQTHVCIYLGFQTQGPCQGTRPPELQMAVDFKHFGLFKREDR